MLERKRTKQAAETDSITYKLLLKFNKTSKNLYTKKLKPKEATTMWERMYWVDIMDKQNQSKVLSEIEKIYQKHANEDGLVRNEVPWGIFKATI